MTEIFDMLHSLRTRRTPFRAIISCPQRSQIDKVLLDSNQPVAQVHRWIVDDLGLDNITYPTLIRYKHAMQSVPNPQATDFRAVGIKRDLAILSLIVDRGEVAMLNGMIPTTSQVMRAIELRAEILAMFPDASGKLEADYRTTFGIVAKAVQNVLTEEQRMTLHDTLFAALGVDDE